MQCWTLQTERTWYTLCFSLKQLYKFRPINILKRLITVFPVSSLVQVYFEITYAEIIDFDVWEIFPDLSLKKDKNIIQDISTDESQGMKKAGDKNPGGRTYSKHGAERANERGFSDKTIDDIINNNAKKRTKEIEDGEITWRYQDSRGNTVITDEYGEKIVTVYSYPRF